MTLDALTGILPPSPTKAGGTLAPPIDYRPMNAIEANAILWRIAKLCGRSRITQGELAQACGLSSSAVNRSLAKTTSDPISRPLAILLSTWNAHPETIPPYLKEDTPPRRQK